MTSPRRPVATAKLAAARAIDGASPAAGSSAAGSPTRQQPLPPLPVSAASLPSPFGAPGSGGIAMPNDHFLNPKPAPKMPWEMEFLERKAASKDPRMVKHCRDEAQWADTIVAGVWQDIRRFALAINDWMMTADSIRDLLAYWTITSQHMLSKLIEMLDPRGTNSVNGLVLCKYMQLVVESDEHAPALHRQCYDLFDKMGSELSVSLLLSANLPVPADPSAAAKKKKGAAGAAATMKAGAGYRHVAAMKQLLNYIDRANPNSVSFEEFSAVAFRPESAFFVAACAPQVVEVMCSRCAAPTGSLPLLSMRWLATTVPVPAGTEQYDADVVLLRQLEAAGGENAKDTKKKKGRASPKKT